MKYGNVEYTGLGIDFFFFCCLNKYFREIIIINCKWMLDIGSCIFVIKI